MRKDWNILRRETNVRNTYRERVAEKLSTLDEEEGEQQGVDRDWKVIQEAFHESYSE